MCQIFFIHSSDDGHLGCFHVLAIVNRAGRRILNHCTTREVPWAPTSDIHLLEHGLLPRGGWRSPRHRCLWNWVLIRTQAAPPAVSVPDRPCGQGFRLGETAEQPHSYFLQQRQWPFTRRPGASGSPSCRGSKYRVNPVQSGWWVKLWQHHLFFFFWLRGTRAWSPNHWMAREFLATSS